MTEYLQRDAGKIDDIFNSTAIRSGNYFSLFAYAIIMAFTRCPHYSAQPLSLGSRGPFVSDTSPKCSNWEGLGRPRTGIRNSWNHISLTSLLGVVNNVNKMLIKMATNINTGSIYDMYLLAYVCLRRNDSHSRRYYQTQYILFSEEL